MSGSPRALWLRIRERISAFTTRERALALALTAALAVALAVIVPAGARAVNAQSAGAFAQVIRPQAAVTTPSEFTGGPSASQAITADNAYAAQLASEHAFHVNHENHVARVKAAAAAKQAAEQAAITYTSSGGGGSSAPATSSPAPAASTPASASGCSDPSGHLSDAQMIMIWTCAGGPSWADSAMLAVTECESGHNTTAYNPSGATGLFQILGAVVPGNLFDAHVNALNAVSKFDASGDTWAQWSCQP